MAELWRYPVKSLQGERLDSAEFLDDGMAFDRAWGIRSAGTGHILTGRRRPELLAASATVVDGRPRIDLPGGDTLIGTGPDVDAALSTWLGEPVSLVEAAHEPAAVAEYFADATDDASTPIEWTMPAGRFVDALPLLVLTASSLRAAAALHPPGDWASRRFRPNVLVETPGEGWLEDSWLHQPVRVGEAEIVPRAACQRCTMVTRPQPGIDRDLEIYRTLLHHHGGTLGVWATVATTGAASRGDAVTVGSEQEAVS